MTERVTKVREGGGGAREREGGKREKEKEREREGGGILTLCSISSSDLICFCSSGVASRARILTAMMIFDIW